MNPAELEMDLAGWGIRAAIAAIILAVVGWLVFSWGESVVQARWDKAESARKSAMLNAVTTRLQSNASLAATQANTNTDLKKGYADEIKTDDSARARGDAHSLRLPATVCRGLATAPQAPSPGRSDATATGTGPLPEPPGADHVGEPTVAVPDPIAIQLRALVDEADRITASCRVAQGFINKNGLAP